MTSSIVPRSFVWRRIHSLTGFFLVLFLVEHLLTNSQIALFWGESGMGFVRAVNSIHNLPYLKLLEVLLLGIPLILHAFWGIKYLIEAKYNSFPSQGKKPDLSSCARNHAFTWQRLTSIVLLIGIILHVLHFRFLHYPKVIHQGKDSLYFVRIHSDTNLYPLADRLGVSLYDKSGQIQGYPKEKGVNSNALSHYAHYENRELLELLSSQAYEQDVKWQTLLKTEQQALSHDQLIAVAADFGTASLFTVRDTFQNPLYRILYTVFIMAAAFHACNGFWTFLITWGLILKASAQKKIYLLSMLLMITLIFLGFSSIWGTYLTNLKA